MANFSTADRGALFDNRDKEGNDQRPDLKGDITLTPDLVRYLAGQVSAGKPAKLRIAAWKRRGEQAGDFLSVKVEKPIERKAPDERGKRLDPNDPPF